MPGLDENEGNDEAMNIYESHGQETESLLPTSRPHAVEPQVEALPKSKPAFSTYKSCARTNYSVYHLICAFFLGTVACIFAQYAVCGPECFTSRNDGQTTALPKPTRLNDDTVSVLAPPYAGSTEVHNFPPTKPTNAFPSLFPSNVGYPGGTPTGAEPAVIATAPVYPTQPGQCSHQLLRPIRLEGESEKPPSTDKPILKGDKPKFNLFRSWGNLSPWYSVGQGRFGVNSSPEEPETCRITGLHFLHRHGARYPTAWSAFGGPAKLGTKLHKSPESWNASGSLNFLNEWTHKLGEELLTPFGRQQLFDLGVSLRMKYGFLLHNFTEKNTLPVFRTESQDRMLSSAMNFAIGFFGYPFEGQYQQSITIEAKGFNNTLAPYKTCPNAQANGKSNRGLWYIRRWADIYLKDTRERLQKHLHGLDLSIEDVYIMQQLCPYETVALGYSKFCELFTEEEWEGFNYALDLQFWYESAFGSPVARVQGIGFIQELVARLTHTPIANHNSSTNSTLNDNPVTFPLGHSLYVDATHEVVVLNIISALNLTSFAESGPLSYKQIDHHRTFRVSELAPFATNVQFQLLDCSSLPGQQIRIIINDGVAPLTGIRGCPEQEHGMCPVDTFVAAQKEIIGQTDWEYECHGDWTVPPGTEWETVTGSPPPKH